MLLRRVSGCFLGVAFGVERDGLDAAPVPGALRPPRRVLGPCGFVERGEVPCQDRFLRSNATPSARLAARPNHASVYPRAVLHDLADGGSVHALTPRRPPRSELAHRQPRHREARGAAAAAGALRRGCGRRRSADGARPSPTFTCLTPIRRPTGEGACDARARSWHSATHPDGTARMFEDVASESPSQEPRGSPCSRCSRRPPPHTPELPLRETPHARLDHRDVGGAAR